MSVQILSKTRGAVEGHLFTALCSALCIVPVLHSNMIDTSTTSALFLEVFFSFNVNVLRTEITFLFNKLQFCKICSPDSLKTFASISFHVVINYVIHYKIIINMLYIMFLHTAYCMVGVGKG